MIVFQSILPVFTVLWVVGFHWIVLSWMAILIAVWSEVIPLFKILQPLAHLNREVDTLKTSSIWCEFHIAVRGMVLFIEV